MRLLSIDLETTGLDPEVHSILEIGAIVEDTNNPLPREECKTFHCYIWEENYVVSAFCWAMHAHLIKKILNLRREGSPNVLTKDKVATKLSDFLYKEYGDYSADDVTLAGKNVGTFDLKFLTKLPQWEDVISTHRRIIDPTLYYTDWVQDVCLPDLKTCKDRAGIQGSVTHEALDDAWDVIQLLRPKYAKA